MKRVRSFILLIVVALVGAAFFTACAEPIDGLSYTLIDDGTAYEVSGIGTVTDTDIVIPAVYKDLPVTQIGYSAFFDESSLTSITIPDSVTNIDNYAFTWCSGLTSITIPDNVTNIGGFAFFACSGLTNITIPDSVKRIGYRAFASCSGLTSIAVATENIVYKSIDNCLLTLDGKNLVLGCKNSVIPSSVIYIGDCAFSDSGPSITIPDSVITIGDYAFFGCNGLTSITISDSVTNIGNYAFFYCSDLTSIIIPDSVISIGDWAFSYCTGLTSIIIPESVTHIGEGAFSKCATLTIYCEALYTLGGWHSDWNSSNCPVVWGA